MKAFKAIAAAVLATTGVLTTSAFAQSFPDKPVKVVLPFPAGTGPDNVMRQVADKLAKRWAHPMTIENRSGANGWTAVEAVKSAPKDGYTLLQVDNLLVTLQPHIFKKLPFDPIKDFEPVASLYQTHFFVVVPTASPWKNIPDLVAEAKAKNGGMTYGSSGVASHMHLGGSMLQNGMNVKMTHVPIKETPQVFVAVANGEMGWAFGTASSSGPMFRSQKVKYLALAAPSRHPSFPNVPTVSEAGGPANFELKSWVALLAPRGTPKAVVDRINADIAAVLAEPDIKEKFTAVGFTPWANTPGWRRQSDRR